MAVYCQVDPHNKTSVTYDAKQNIFAAMKYIWKFRLQYGSHFVSAVLRHATYSHERFYEST